MAHVESHLNQMQLARRSNLSPRTLERWRYYGEGPAFFKIGRRVVYRIEDVEAFEASRVGKRGGRRSPGVQPDPN